MEKYKTIDWFSSEVERYLSEDGVKSLPGLAEALQIDGAELKQILAKGGEKARILHAALTRIEKELVENGLKGKYNATITSFILKSSFGYREKREEPADAAGSMKIELCDELKQYSE